MTNIRMSPNGREVLSAISTITGKQEYLTSTGGVLNSGATLSGSVIPATGLSSAAAVQIVDGSGDQITSFGGGTQYTDGGTPPTHPIGPTTIWDSGGTWKHISTATPLPVTDSMIPSLGNTTASGSLPVTLASDSNGPVRLTDGTNTANVVAGDSGFNGVATASATKTYTFTTSVTGAQVLLANTPCEGFSFVEVVLTSAGVGLSYGGQFSPTSGGTYLSTSTWSSTLGASPTGLGNLTTTIYGSPVHGNYFQLNITAMTGGTTTGTVTFHAIPLAGVPSIVIASQSGSWTVGSNSATGSTVPSNAFLMGVQNSSNTLVALNTQSKTGAAGASGNSILAVENYIYNGSSNDSMISATAASNTTGTGLLGAGILGFDGTDWQYAGINGSHALKVDGSAITQPVSLATNTPTLQSGSTTAVTQATAANLNATIVGTINLSPTASGGWTPYLANAITTTVTVSSAAGKFGGYQLINLNSVPVYLQCFDTTGAVTLGSTAPTFVMTLPANATAANGISATQEMANGIALANGLKVAATTTVNGATTVSTGVSGTILYH